MPSLYAPANPAGTFLQAYQTGARISEANAALAQRDRALAQEQELAQARLKAQREENERQLLLRQQQLEMQRAYRQEQAALQKSRLDQVAAVNQWKVQQAAQALQRQQRAAQRIAAGENPASVMLQEGAYTATGAAPLAREAMTERRMATMPQGLQAYPVTEAGTTNRIPGMVAVPTPGGYLRAATVPGFASQAQAETRSREYGVTRRINLLNARRRELAKRFTIPPSSTASPDRVRAYRETQDELGRIDTELEQLAPSVGARAALPAGMGAPDQTAGVTFPTAPASPKDRKKGETYQTPKGPHTWTGSGWVAYEPPSHEEQ